MNLKGLIATLFLCVFAFYSCERDDISNEELNTSTNSELKGIAHFPSQDNFDQSIETLRKTGILPSEMQGVSSLNQTLKLKSSETEDDVSDSLVYSDLLCELLNDRYEIAIGNVFFKISEQGTFFTSLENYQWLRELDIENIDITNSELTTYALGYSYSQGMYKIKNYNALYFFDTFRKKIQLLRNPMPIFKF